MINHIRTLLLNINGEPGFRSDVPGEEFVPPSYRARELHPSLRLPMQILFGTDPDRMFRNYRLRQIMTLLHESPLAEYLYTHDPRVTYWPPADAGFYDQAFGVTVVQTGGLPATLHVIGEPAADDAVGRCEQIWEISASEFAYTAVDGLSEVIPLGRGLAVQFEANDPSASWRVTARGRPTTDFGQVLTNLGHAMGQGGLSWVFRPPQLEPYATFMNVWNDHPLTLYRYAALFLAIAFRLDALQAR